MAEHDDVTQVLNQFNELRVSLARIEEGIKPIDEIKRDVGQLKVGFTDVESSLKSAHKRIDNMEKDFEKVPTKAEYKNQDDRIARIESKIGLVEKLIITAIVMALIGLVIVQN